MAREFQQSRPWLAIRKPLAGHRAIALKALSMVVPLLVWCVISYVPWVWHPMMKVQEPGSSKLFQKGAVVERAAFEAEQGRLMTAKRTLMVAVPSNPIFLPAPHEVGQALWNGFTQPPARKGAPWFHERVLESVKVLAAGFALACVVAVPLGLLCGTFDLFSKLIEPFIDFMRYMPAPAFGALMVAIFGLAEGPKVSIIFIGIFFNLLLVTANTTRTLDTALLEAAQTLGAKGPGLVRYVVVPGVMPVLYNDLRIALGVGWVYLTIAELFGEMSGISEFINQQGKFRHYPEVFAGIVMLGVLGFITDQVLAFLGRKLFPWHSREKKGVVWSAVTGLLRRGVGRAPVPATVPATAGGMSSAMGGGMASKGTVAGGAGGGVGPTSAGARGDVVGT